VARRVVFSPEARDDLLELYDYIAERSGTARAFSYTERIHQYCAGFSLAPERGSKMDDLRPGLRVVGFERRVTIAFHVIHDAVVIDRILYGGRDLGGALESG
jgi:toxin ParE1/3/4